MRSVRLDNELERRLQQAAEVTGEPVSDLIREAVRRRCDEVLADRLDRRLADVVGSAASGKKSSSKRTGRDFAKLLSRRNKAKK